MAEDAEKSILLSRFPSFEGKEGEERDWHNLARVIFEREVRDWPVEQIRLFKNAIPKMRHGGGTTTRNRYHHKLIVSFKSKPTWAVACCIKIMFGGWEGLQPTAIGTHMKKAFPDHDCSSWACPAIPAPEPQQVSESEAVSTKKTRKRGPGPKGSAQSSTGTAAGTNKRRRSTKSAAIQERTVTPEALSKKAHSVGPTTENDQDEAAIKDLRNAYGYVDASYAIKPDPFQVQQAFKLPNFAPPTEAEKEANIRRQIQPLMSTLGTLNSTMGPRGSTVSCDVNNQAGTAQTSATSSTPLLFGTGTDKKGGPNPTGVLPSIEASQVSDAPTPVKQPPQSGN
jgi:hypothetical protein